MALPFQVFRVGRVTCGAIQFTPGFMVAADLSHFRSMTNRQFAGLLGGNFFNSAPFEIDYRKRTLTIFDPAKFTPPDRLKAIPIRLHNGIPMVEIAVEGHRADAGVDTGNSVSAAFGAVWVLDHRSLFDDRPTWSDSAVSIKGDQSTSTCQVTVSAFRFRPIPMWCTCYLDYAGSDNVETTGTLLGAGAPGGWVLHVRLLT